MHVIDIARLGPSTVTEGPSAPARRPVGQTLGDASELRFALVVFGGGNVGASMTKLVAPAVIAALLSRAAGVVPFCCAVALVVMAGAMWSLAA